MGTIDTMVPITNSGLSHSTQRLPAIRSNKPSYKSLFDCRIVDLIDNLTDGLCASGKGLRRTHDEPAA
jgi:hypothetical protein